jgi:hypothetical protein
MAGLFYSIRILYEMVERSAGYPGLTSASWIAGSPCLTVDWIAGPRGLARVPEIADYLGLTSVRWTAGL